MKSVISLAVILLIQCAVINAQVKISNNNSSPDGSAMLDIESSSKGLLLPRMSGNQMHLISNAAKGLLVFNLTDSSFYMHLDSGWTKIATGLNVWTKNGDDIYSNNTGNTGIGTTNPARKLHIVGSEQLDGNLYMPVGTSTSGVIYTQGLPFLHNSGVSLSNVYLGTNAGSFHPLAKKNVAIGQGALQASDGADNVAIGWMAAHTLTGGSQYTESYKNTFVGYLSGLNATGGINNVALGEETGSNLSAGSSGNVLLGAGAGYYVTTGSGNCLIGNNVQTSTGSLNSGVGGNSGGVLTSGSYNSWLGTGALNNNKIGWYNTALGAFSQNADTSGGWFNVYLGAFSGLQTQGANNVFLGSFSGNNDQPNLNNTLIINNSNETTHLINGKFNQHKVGINKILTQLDYTLDVGGEVRVGSLGTAPAGSNGVIYYNSTDSKLKTYENGTWKNAVNENAVKTKSTDPDTSDVPVNTFHVWKNTSSGNIYLWVNDGGVLKKVQLQ